MTFASIVASIFGGDNLISTLPIFAFVAFLSAYLANYGRIKYISITPLLLVFVITPLTMINAIVLIPIILFIIWTIPTANEEVSMFNYYDAFRSFLIVFGSILLFTLFLGGLRNDTLLFAISFLFNTIVFMRLIRHDESVLRQTRLKVMNAASIVGIMIGAILFSTEIFWTFIGRAFNFIFVNLLAPVFRFLLRILFTVLQFIFGIFRLDYLFARFYDGIQSRMEMPELLYEEELFEAREGANFPLALFIVIGIIIFTYITIKIFKILTKLRPAYISDEVEEERFFLDDDKKKRRFRRRRENQIREIYLRFLALIKKQEVKIPLHFTSSDVEGLVATKFNSERSSDLRAEYIRVRYGESDYTKDDVKRVKGLYKEVKSEIEG